jgi:hypothetical protein
MVTPSGATRKKSWFAVSMTVGLITPIRLRQPSGLSKLLIPSTPSFFDGTTGMPIMRNTALILKQMTLARKGYAYCPSIFATPKFALEHRLSVI